MGVTYKDSGVDIEAGAKAVELIKDKVQRTFRFFPGQVCNEVGGYAAITRLKNGTVAVSSVDGVGTKLKLAIKMGVHNTVGIDLVAMSVNDILVYGPRTGFFLDYIAMHKQIPERTEQIVAGVVEGCEQAGIALIGGEMAEMGDMYKRDDYDLAGFAVGFADSMDELIMGKDIKPNMHVYGIASSGLHSNGYSMVWRVFGINFDLDVSGKSQRELNGHREDLGCRLYEELLRPTKIYVRDVEMLRRKYEITGMGNITGGGFVENPPRILPAGLAIQINLGSWPTPPIFKLIQRKGNVEPSEMLRTFNNGIGFIVISPDEIQEEGVYKIGQVIEGSNDVKFVSKD